MYKERWCCKCDTRIMVKESDNAARYYCQSCAWAQVGYTYTESYESA
jgi:hypothetical protein